MLAARNNASQTISMGPFVKSDQRVRISWRFGQNYPLFNESNMACIMVAELNLVLLRLEASTSTNIEMIPRWVISHSLSRIARVP